jgi:ADP-heptose:LPS heptosyltransferase
LRPPKPGGGHRVAENGRMLALDPPPAPKLWTLPRHDATAAALIPPGSPVLAVGPTANWRGKTWRIERFVELVRRLTAPGAPFAGARVAVFSAPGEAAAAQPLLDSLPPGTGLPLMGETDLLTVFAALKRCAFYVGNDSGLMHLAATAGVPTLGLFGPSHDALYAPWGARCAVARTALAYDRLVGGPGYDHRATDTRMDSLSVEAAHAAALDLISGGSR